MLSPSLFVVLSYTLVSIKTEIFQSCPK